MKKVSQIHEDFINAARRPMTFGKLPVKSVEPSLPVVPIDKWQKLPEGKLYKRFLFQDIPTRNDFVERILDHEDEINHRASIKIEDTYVDLTVFTKDVDVITELDKEYAKAANDIFKDVVYSMPHDE